MKKILAVIALIIYANAPLKAQNSPKVQQQAVDIPNNWYMLDYETDHFYGISADKAYIELLKDKPSEKVIVAVIDGGIDTSQQDLKNVLWRNPKEIPHDGKDNDGDGYVDDYYGWNFIGGKSDTSNLVFDSAEEERIYFKYKPLFEDLKSIEQVKKKDRGKYGQWRQAWDLLTAEAPQTKRVRNLARLMKAFPSLQQFREVIKKDTFYLADIQAFKPTDWRGELFKNNFSNILSQAPMGTSNVTMAAAFQKMIDSLNAKARQIPFTNKLNSRATIVKDNYDNISDRFYGNGNISVPISDIHGTHVAGIIGAERNNNLGVDGVADNVAIMGVRAIPQGDEHDKDVALAIRFAVDHGAKVINMSFGKSISPNRKWVEDAIRYAQKHDVLLVRAAGNSNDDLSTKPTYPTQFYGKNNSRSFDDVITVGASGTTAKELIVYFSNYGATTVDVFAPGMDIYSTLPGVDHYGKMSGTSMSAPVVTGIACVLRSYFPKLTAPQIKQIIIQSVQKIDFMVDKPGTIEKVPMSNLCISGGIVNLYNAVKLAEQMNE